MKKRIALWLCICLLCVGGNAFAMEASINYNTNVITVSAPDEGEKTAVILIRNQATEAYEYADLLFAEEDGFSATLALSEDAEEGKYSVVLVRANGTEEEVFDFVNVSESTRSAVLAAISDILNETDEASQEEKLDAFVQQYAEILDIDTSMYEEITSKTTLIELLAEKSYATFAQFMESFPQAMEEAYVAQSKEKVVESIKEMDIAEITGVLEENENILGIELTEVYYQYESYVNQRLKAAEDLTLENIAEKFDEIMAIPYLNAASRSEIASVIEEQDQYLNIYDIIYANSDDVVVKILKKLAETEFEERSEIVAAIIEVIGESSSSSSTSTSSSSSGTSSGGSTTRRANVDIAITRVSTAASGTMNTANEEQTGPFDDIDSVLWAKEGIEKLAEMGIVSGRGDRIFAPEDNITRAEAVKILAGAFSLPEGEAVLFSDVAEDSWYAPYISMAVSANLIEGDGNGNFNPNDPISRQDFAVMICRYIGSSEQTTEMQFSDTESIAAYAKEAVQTLYGMGIIAGKDDGRFDPYGNLTRAECAKIVYGIIARQ